MQCTIFLILPTWAVFFAFFLPLSVDITTNGKQDVLKEPEANTDLLYFSAPSYYKSSVETDFPIFAIAFLH